MSSGQADARHWSTGPFPGSYSANVHSKENAKRGNRTQMKYFFVYVYCLNYISGNPLAHLTSRPIHTYYWSRQVGTGTKRPVISFIGARIARVALKSLHKAFRTILDWALIIRNVCSYCLLLLLLPRAWPVCDVYTFWRLNKSCEWPTWVESNWNWIAPHYPHCTHKYILRSVSRQSKRWGGPGKKDGAW